MDYNAVPSLIPQITMSAPDFRETSCDGTHWYQLCQSLNLGTIGVGLCLVASLKILVGFSTKSLVYYVAQDMLNILLCMNQVVCFCSIHQNVSLFLNIGCLFPSVLCPLLGMRE